MAAYYTSNNAWPGMTIGQLLGKVDLTTGGWAEAQQGKAQAKGEDWGNLGYNPQSAWLGPQLWGKKLSMSALEGDGSSWEDICQPRSDFGQQMEPRTGGTGNNGSNDTNVVTNNNNAFPTLVDPAASYYDHQPQNFSQADKHSESSNEANLPKAEPTPSPTPHWNHNSPLALEARNRMDNRSYMNDDLMLSTVPGINFDPSKPTFTEEDLKPQPIIRKRRKIFVMNEDKDDRYWAKRFKNNEAARRSREAQRVKKNQIALRAGYLEKENGYLKSTLKQLNIENQNTRINLEIMLDRIKTYEKSKDQHASHASRV